MASVVETAVVAVAGASLLLRPLSSPPSAVRANLGDCDRDRKPFELLAPSSKAAAAARLCPAMASQSVV